MRSLLLIVLLGLTSVVSAQPFGNEWIDYDRTYYSFKMVERGIYRIDRAELEAAGMPITQIDPRGLQLFAREREQPIFVSGEGDGSFDEQDYIEFYAEGNDGTFDTQMYLDADHQPDIDYSLINDTITYFLTWSEVLDNNRIPLISDNDFGSYDMAPYLWTEAKAEYRVQYNEGPLLAFNADIRYVEGEGWMSGRFGKGANPTSLTTTLQTTNAASGAPPAQGEAVSAAATNAATTGEFNHHLRVSRPGATLADLVYAGYKMNRVVFSVPSGALGSGELPITHEVIDDLGVATDNHRLSHVSLRYAHTRDISDLTDRAFSVDPNPDIAQDRYHVQLQNIDLDEPLVYVTSGQPYRIEAFASAQGLNFLLPDQSFGARSEVFVADADEVRQVIDLAPVHGSGTFIDYAAQPLDSAFVIISHPRLMAEADDYAAYRGGLGSGRDAMAVDVEQLYHQYGHGVEKHPLAMRRFIARLYADWPSPPAQLLLLGKSIQSGASSAAATSRQSEINFRESLVPSFGSPPSDDMLTAGLIEGSLLPALPTGRVSAITADEASDYLAKVIDHEAATPALWMKNVLHFGGGVTNGEQSQFRGYLENYESIITDTCFGANVSTFLKTSSLPIEVNESEIIADIIEEGVSMFTFFGHAGGSGFDVSLDDPNNLEWGGFPFILVNSCFSGDIHQPGHVSTSEDYVLIEDKGAIGFLSHIRSGLAGPLDRFSTEMHRQITYKDYGASVGAQVLATKQDQLVGLEDNVQVLNDLLALTLEGDPAVQIHSFEKPDMRISEQSIFFTPTEITTVIDSFYMHVVVDNVGKATAAPFTVEAIRQLPTGGQEVVSQLVQGSRYRDTVVFAFGVDFATSFGLNTFEVNVDLPQDVIDETNDLSNNSVNGIDLLISDGGVYPVLPAPFAVVDVPNVTLKASTGNPFASEKTYRIQADTTDLFSSPMLVETEITQVGGVLEWSLPITLSDSLVCYWRVAEAGDAPRWRESSFQYITGTTGWGQAHYYQFEEDAFGNIIYDRPEREFDFLSGEKTLSARVVGGVVDGQTEYFIDFNSQEYDGCQTLPNFHVVVVDPVTLEPWRTEYDDGNGTVLNEGFDFGNFNNSFNCRNRPDAYFIFRQNNATQMDAMMDMLENEVPVGHYVMVYSWRWADPAVWSPELRAFFSSYGMQEVSTMNETLPFIAMGVAGQPMTMQETIGEEPTSIITAEYPMLVSGNQGNITSTLIGPASNWEELSWRAFSEDTGTADEWELTLIGVSPTGVETPISTLLYDQPQGQESDLDALVSAAQYPYLRLRATMRDTSSLTPLQIDRWHVLYQPVPEAALDPSIAFDYYAENVQEGEQIRLVSTIRNISAVDMDSLLVEYWVRDAQNVRHDIDYDRQRPLLAGESLTDTITFDTRGFRGVNSLWVEANPYVEAIEDYDQIEQFHFNNLGQLKFTVAADEENPVLDVTFDGVRILDGELVSTRPDIRILLDDENRFLLMNEATDTTYFDVFLRTPDGSREPIYFQNSLGQEQMIFEPATSTENVAKIIYRPELAQDGVYQLIVIAADKSGNQSGDIDYRIRFEIDSEAGVTEVLNYPNPFSTSTRFVFTLTGTDVPDYIKIQIMTVSGRVVREIFKEELGPLRIGRNVTDFAWDGTDRFGDPLGNGVYLYRVIVKDQGEDLRQRQTSASQFFKKGFGKMYLMR